MSLAFDSRTHTYSIDGKVVPSVTGIMREVGFVGSYQFMESHHKYRGHAVHQGSAIIDMGGIAELGPVPAHLAEVKKQIENGYWPAFSAFKTRTKWQGKIWECPFIDPEVGYGGTPDSVGEFPDCLAMLDLKSGSVPLLVMIQLALYWLLILRGKPVNPDHPGLGWLQEVVKSGRPIKRMALQLTKEGKDRLITHTSRRGEEPEDFSSDRWLQVALSVLEVYKTRERFGMLGKEQNGNQRTGGY